MVALGAQTLGGAVLALLERAGASLGPLRTRIAAVRIPRREALAAVLGLGLVAAVELPRDLRPRRADRLAERQAAEWLREQELPAGPVAASRLRVAYYAGERFVPLPSGPPGGMLSYLQEWGARYVIVGDENLDEHVGLRSEQGRGLRLVHRAEAGGRSAAVFEVRGRPAAKGAGSG
jgi:hypothetical protein